MVPVEQKRHSDGKSRAPATATRRGGGPHPTAASVGASVIGTMPLKSVTVTVRKIGQVQIRAQLTK